MTSPTTTPSTSKPPAKKIITLEDIPIQHRFKKAGPTPIPKILPPGYRRSFLLIGDSGTGKTRSAGTFPRPYFIDLDDGVSSIGPEFTNYKRFTEAPWNMKPRRGQYEWCTAWPKMYDHINEIGAKIDKGTWEFDTLVIDSLTLLQEIALNNVFKNGKGSPPEFIDPGQWGAQMRAVQGLIQNMNTWAGLKVFTAHVQRDKNDITGQTEMLPLVTGKLAGKIGIFFDEIYFCEITGQGAARKWVYKTKSTASMRQARSRINIADDVEQDWKNVWPALSPFFKLDDVTEAQIEQRYNETMLSETTSSINTTPSTT